MSQPSSQHPFTQFVMKVASRCNLNCSYCYMYNLGDDTWRGQPAFMSDQVTRTTGEKIANHARRHNLKEINIVIHGGEPLLCGTKTLRRWIELLEGAIGLPTSFAVQTNGTLIDREWAEFFVEHNIDVGVSMDGPQTFHDQYRVDHHGDGSYAKVLRGIQALLEHPSGPSVFRGVLSVINLEIPPRQYIDFINSIGVLAFSVLLPQHNHSRPPPGARGAYAQWLTALFTIWRDEAQCEHTSAVFFETLVHAMIDRHSAGNEFFGNKALDMLIIETDGGIEPSDSLKSCEPHLTKLGLNVLTHEIDDVYAVPFMMAAQSAKTSPCDTCKSCEFYAVCGGGRMSDRYSAANGFDNPSVYCDDLKELFAFFRDRVVPGLPPTAAAAYQALGNP